MPNLAVERDCPIEVWTQIFDIACNDDGSTARSLSEVSRHMRSMSLGHRYNSVKLTSADRLLKSNVHLNAIAQQGLLGPGGKLGIRSLYIALPTCPFSEAYPASTYAPEDDSEDDDYAPSDLDSTSSASDEEDPSPSDDELGVFDPLDASAESLDVELADIINDSLCNEALPLSISNLSELQLSPTAINQYEYWIYSAIRALLESSSDTLEIFSLYYRPRYFIPDDILFPSLPRLRNLSLYLGTSRPATPCPVIPSTSRSLPDTICPAYRPRTHQLAQDQAILRYPSVRVLRLLGSLGKFPWWEDILGAVPNTKQVQVVTSQRLRRDTDRGNRTWPKLKQGWTWTADMLDLSENVWLEDINGCTAPPRLVFVDHNYLDFDRT